MNRLVRVKLWTQSLEALMLPTTWSTDLYTAIRNASWQRRQKAVEESLSQWRTESYVKGPEAAYANRRRQGRVVCVIKRAMLSMIEGHASGEVGWFRANHLLPTKKDGGALSLRRTSGKG